MHYRIFSQFRSALLVLSIFLHSFSHAVQPFKIALNNGEVLVLEMVENIEADVTPDISMALLAFEGAFRDASIDEIATHFGPERDIRGYYQKVFDEDDVAPFHAGRLLWIRAFLNNNLVGWMTLLPNFREPETVYVSTLAVDSGYRKLGIGRKMLGSIHAHWAKGAKELNLVVRRINYEALPFYEHLGFVPAPDIQSDLVGDPKGCLFLRLSGFRLSNLLGIPANIQVINPTLDSTNTQVENLIGMSCE